MSIVVNNFQNLTLKNVNPNSSCINPLQIVICLQELESLRQMLNGKSVADGTYIVQGYIARGLQEQGHRLTFLAPHNIGEVECDTDLQKPTIAPRSWSASSAFKLTSKSAWRIQKLLRVPYLNVFSNYRLYDACLQCLPGHDVVYERNGLYNVGVAKACKKLGIPYVMFFEADQILEHEYMGKPIKGLLRQRAESLLRYNLDAADCIICVSEPAKAHLVSTRNVPKEKVVVLANGVNVQLFRPYPEARAQVRAELGIGANPLVVFVGSFFEWHDVATLLDGFAKTLRSYPTARLVLVGEGHQRQAMMQHAAALGIQDAVQFTGLIEHSQVPPLVSAADIAVAPYPLMKHELWLSPLKLFEYMASGTAVVASEVGQVAQVIRDQSNGLLVPPGDSSAMMAALVRLLDDVPLRARLGRQARDDAVQKHSWNQYISRLEKIFTAVIGGESLAAL